MSWLSDVIDDVVASVLQAWPETEDIAMRDSVAARRNWREQLSNYEANNGTGMPLPTAIIASRPMMAADSYGDGNDCYEWPFDLYYLTSTRNANGQPKTAQEIDEELLGKAEAYRANVYTNVPTTYTVVRTPMIDSSLGTEVNQYLISKNFHVKSIKVTVVALCGVASTA